MKEKNKGYSLLFLISMFAGIIVSLLGIIVLRGWYTHNTLLIQVLPTFVPMQYNTALGFLLCGTGLILIVFDLKQYAWVLGTIVGALGLLTLIQYLFGLDFRIDQALMKHYITVETSHPGRMAPNTALNFILSGFALLKLCKSDKIKSQYIIAGLLSSIVIALSLVALFGYLSNVETAYGWGQYTRMAIHTSIGFIFTGIGILTFAWRECTFKDKLLFPKWFPYPVGISIATFSIAIWQALHANFNTETSGLPAVVLVSGLLTAVFMTITILLAQKSTHVAKKLELKNLDLIKAKEEVEESEKNLKQAQKVAHLGHWSFDSATRELNWSEEIFRIFGIDPKNEKPSYNAIHPDDRYYVNKEYITSLNNKTKFDVTYKIIRSNGNTKYVHEQCKTYYDKFDKPLQSLGIIQDITKIKQAENKIIRLNDELEEKILNRTKQLRDSEEKSRLILESAGDGIIGTNTRGEIVFINSAACKLLGYKSNEIIGKKIHKLIHHTKADGSKYDIKDCPMEKVYKTYKSYFIKNEVLWRKDGTNFPVEYHSTPIKKDNNVTGSVVTFKDISEQLKFETDLKKAKKEADKANRAKSDFLANMSHEIRTPMHSIIGFTDILEKEINDKIYKDYLNSIKSSSHDLLTIINDILDFSKIEAGKIELQYSYVNINDMFNELKNMFTVIVNKKNIDFLYEPEHNLPLLIYTDEIRLKQILINLVNNAIKFTEKGYIRLTAKSIFNNNKPAKLNSDFSIDLIIKIEDTGIGISEKFKEKIFESFAQQNGQSKKKFGGTGLGLAISKNLVNIMGGEITVQSEINKGSIFKIVLKDLKCSNNIKETPVISKIDTNLIVFKKSKVIIVDNSEINRKFLVSSLIKSKIKTYEVENGLEAFELAKKINPGLIITDLNMPVMDGFQLFNKIKHDKTLKHIPVIIVTASVLKRTKKKIINAGFDGFLVKPFTQEDLHIELVRFLPYEKKTKNEIIKTIEIEQKINSETLNNILPLLKGYLYNKWELLQKHQPINKVNSFADELIEIGNKYDVPVLLSYGNHLKETVTSFNIDEMLKLIKSYKQLLNKIANN